MFDFIREDHFYTSDNLKISYGVNFNLKDEENKKKNIIVFNYGLVCSNAHFKYQIPFLNELGFCIKWLAR